MLLGYEGLQAQKVRNLRLGQDQGQTNIDLISVSYQGGNLGLCHPLSYETPYYFCTAALSHFLSSSSLGMEIYVGQLFTSLVHTELSQQSWCKTKYLQNG